MSNAPYDYNLLNIAGAFGNPSGVTVSNTESAAFFRRYLLQKAMSVFEWTLPGNWDSSYFLYNLYLRGHIAVVETDKYGVICQGGTLSGYNIYYQPRQYIIVNPLIEKGLEPLIGRDCMVFRMTKDWCGIGDLVAFYADYMALAVQTLGGNLFNSKLSYIAAAGNKNAAESVKKALDDVLSGKPATVVDSSLLNKDGALNLQLLLQNVGQNFIAPEVVNVLAAIEQRFDTVVGIPNSNTTKRERLITDEVNSNNVETFTMADMWYGGWKETIRKAKTMFPGALDMLDVRWRVSPELEVGPNVD